jgi:hypothetical protein
MQEMFRIQPSMPAHMYKSYKWVRPLGTHWTEAACWEVGCEQYRNGWVTTIDETTGLGQKQAHYIRHDITRKHTETKNVLGLTEFKFESGQKCFRQHKKPLEREPFFLIAGGDHRGNPAGVPARYMEAEDWIDDFANHQDKIKSAIERG